jgi:hypothetical protein
VADGSATTACASLVAWSNGRSAAVTDVGRMSVGELLGGVLADAHADVSRNAGYCLAQPGRDAEVTAAADAGYGLRSPGPDRAAT